MPRTDTLRNRVLESPEEQSPGRRVPERRHAFSVVRTWLVLIGVLAAGAPSPAPAAIPPEARDIAGLVAELAAQIQDLDADDPTEVYKLASELARAEGSAGYYALEEKWSTITEPSVKQLIMQQFTGARVGDGKNRLQKKLIEVLNLGVHDPAPIVQVTSLRGIKELALRDFAEDFSGYEAWYSSVQGKDANLVLAAEAEAFVARAASVKGADVRKIVDFFEDSGHLMMEIELSRSAAMKAGWGRVLTGWLTSDDLAAQAAMRLAGNLKFRRKELQEVIMPLVKGEGGASMAVRAWAVAVMGDSKSGWAVDELAGVLQSTYQKPSDLRALLAPMSRTFAAIGDARGIPALIAAAEAEGTPAAIYTVGQNGLSPLTGVKQTEEKDVAWWRAWWEKNRARYGPKFKDLEIPSRYTPEQLKAMEEKAAKERAERAAEAELKDIPATMVAAGYDNNQRYVLIGHRPGKSEPEGGFKVLLVLPGGDGGADYKAFCQRIWKNCLDDKWVVCQLVAPKWDKEQSDSIVWPTKGSPYKAAKFTTEDFAENVIADVRKRCEINVKQVYVLGWSSGGPPAYALMLRKKPDTNLAGALIAMSVFKPEQTDGLQHAKGRRFFLLHSPEDKTVPLRFAEEAKLGLSKSGGAAELKTYEGGHGWLGDPFANIKAGVEWLAK